MMSFSGKFRIGLSPINSVSLWLCGIKYYIVGGSTWCVKINLQKAETQCVCKKIQFDSDFTTLGAKYFWQNYFFLTQSLRWGLFSIQKKTSKMRVHWVVSHLSQHKLDSRNAILTFFLSHEHYSHDIMFTSPSKFWIVFSTTAQHSRTII